MYIMNSWYHSLHMHFCTSIQDFKLPEGAALPIGGEDKIHTHVLMEIHYDNPKELSGW